MTRRVIWSAFALTGFSTAIAAFADDLKKADLPRFESLSLYEKREKRGFKLFINPTVTNLSEALTTLDTRLAEVDQWLPPAFKQIARQVTILIEEVPRPI